MAKDMGEEFTFLKMAIDKKGCMRMETHLAQKLIL